jgi:HEPN domain-containing protein
MFSIHIQPLIAVQDLLTYVTLGIHSNSNFTRLNATQRADFEKHLRPALAQLSAPDFSMTRQALERLLETVRETDDAQRILFDAADLRRRLLDQFTSVSCLCLSHRESALFAPTEPLFGADVERKFPKASEDVAEAGKCLALGRYTASVFHLMRVTELGVQQFGDTLGVQLAHELNWQNILDQLNKTIKQRNPKASDTKRFAEAASHLYNVKLAWRNEVMHPKETYTEEQAKEVFEATRAFMRDLCALV